MTSQSPLFTGVRGTLYCITAILVAICCTYGVLDVIAALRLRSAAEGMRVSTITGDSLFQAAGHWAAERGATTAVLSSTAPVSGESRGLILRHRQAAEAAYAAALDSLRAEAPFPGRESLLEEVEARHRAVAGLRRAIDPLLATPDGDRRDQLARDWFAAATELIMAAQRLRGAAEFQPEVALVQSIERRQLQQAVWVMSEFAGRERARIAALIAAGQPIGPADSAVLAGYRGQVEDAWKTVQTFTERPGADAEIRDQVAEVGRTYFGQFQMARDEVYRSGPRAAYPMSAEAWFAEATRAIEAILRLGEVCGAKARELASLAAAHSARNALFSGLGLAVALAIGVAAFWLIAARIVRPLKAVVTAMGRLAAGDMTTPLPGLARVDEIGDIARAIQIFRENALSEIVPDGIFHADRDGAWIRTNSRLQRILGRPEADLLGRGWLDSVAQPDRSDIAALWSGIVADRRSVRTELRILRPDGTPGMIQFMVRPFHGSGALLPAFIGMVTDVTELHAVKEELLVAKERYDFAVDGSLVGIWDWDLGDRSLWCSPGLKELLGLSEAFRPTVAGMLDLVYPEDRSLLVGAFGRHLRCGERLKVEVRMRHADGSVHWYLVRGSSQRGDDGHAIRMAGSLADITVRKEGEAELIASRHAAELASRAKSAFLASLSHELRTPLNAIIGFSDMLRHQATGSEGHWAEYAQDIHQSGEHLLDLINGLLDMAKIEAGRLELRETMVDLAEEMVSVGRLFMAELKHKRIDLTLAPSTALPPVRADQRAVRQMLLNIVGNAVKFTRVGGTVAIAAELRPDGAGVALAVRDTGIGIPREKLPQLGQPFTQISNQYTREHEGIGIGLYITRSLIELHGGRLEIDSDMGQGTCVTLVFPAGRVIQSSIQEADGI